MFQKSEIISQRYAYKEATNPEQAKYDHQSPHKHCSKKVKIINFWLQNHQKTGQKKHISAKMKEMSKSVTRHYPITKESILGLKISDWRADISGIYLNWS